MKNFRRSILSRFFDSANHLPITITTIDIMMQVKCYSKIYHVKLQSKHENTRWIWYFGATAFCFWSFVCTFGSWYNEINVTYFVSPFCHRIHSVNVNFLSYSVCMFCTRFFNCYNFLFVRLLVVRAQTAFNTEKKWCVNMMKMSSIAVWQIHIRGIDGLHIYKCKYLSWLWPKRLCASSSCNISFGLLMLNE